MNFKSKHTDEPRWEILPALSRYYIPPTPPAATPKLDNLMFSQLSALHGKKEKEKTS